MAFALNALTFGAFFLYNWCMNFFVNRSQIENEYIYISGSDVNHIKNVLRKNIGDMIELVCEEKKYSARIVEFNQDVVKCCIVEEENIDINDFKLTIFQGLAKSDKIEFIIQKCTEIGVYEIIPVEMKRSVVKLDSKDKIKKIERWKKIAEAASKQSRRNFILKVDKIASFNQMCDELNNYDCILLAYENEKNISLKDVIRNNIEKYSNVAVIIGPEGGFDEEEVKKLIEIGAKSVSLGKNILRTETAPVVVSAIIMYEKNQ